MYYHTTQESESRRRHENDLVSELQILLGDGAWFDTSRDNKGKAHLALSYRGEKVKVDSLLDDLEDRFTADFGLHCNGQDRQFDCDQVTDAAHWIKDAVLQPL